MNAEQAKHRELCLEIVNLLEAIRDGGPDRGDQGICYHVEYDWETGQQYIEKWWDTSAAAFRAWPLFSGDYNYPITTGDQQDWEFDEAQARSTMWDRSTEYGRLRWELLDHLIAWYTKHAEVYDDPEVN